jgi:nucleotide-binding universal stress UspA family protein
MSAQILVGVDGSVSAKHAARWAAAEAARRGMGLRLVHACVFPPLVPDDDLYLEQVRQQGRRWLAEAGAVARDAAPEIEPDDELMVGSPSGILVEASRSAELVVVGSRGIGGFRSMLVGSVAVTLAAHGHCPLVMVRGRTVDDPPPERGPVVLGLDGSALSDLATGFAFETAGSRGAELVAVHVWDDLAFAGPWSPMPPVPDVTAVEADLRRELAEYLSDWQAKYPTVAVHQVLARGHPAGQLLDYAREARLVVVGSRGRGAVAGFGGLGSTSQAVLHNAACPVAVVRAHEAGKPSV